MLNTELYHEKSIYSQVEEYNKTPKGLSYSIVMRNMKTKGLDIFNRPEQPCYGELRKYKSTHGDECTKPESNRPGDLRYPFPDGKPEALGFYLYPYNPGKQNSELLIKTIFSNKSPWAKGFGKIIEFITNDKQICGVILLDMELDPTVLVNALSFNRTYYTCGNVLAKLLDKGMSSNEALLTIMSFGNAWDIGSNHLSPCYDYYFPVKCDIKRFLNCDPHDLTGGTFKDRFDYDRKHLHKIFWGDVSVYQQFYKKLGVNPNSYSDRGEKPNIDTVVKVMKEIIEENS